MSLRLHEWHAGDCGELVAERQTTEIILGKTADWFDRDYRSVRICDHRCGDSNPILRADGYIGAAALQREALGD